MALKAEVVTLIPVKKMARAIEFYTKKLDAKVLMRGYGEMKDWWSSIEIADREFWLVGADATEKRKLAYQALTVKNIKKAVAKLTDKGVKFEKGEAGEMGDTVDGPISSGKNGSTAFFKDTESNLWMVIQGPDE
jgi:catechol 2,3-dioxygenase-like lactoylglutathione lyase family enzyme